MAPNLPFQYDIYNEYGIDRTSLSTLREVIHALQFGDDPDLNEVYDYVTRVMQETLDTLAAERRFPVIG